MTTDTQTTTPPPSLLRQDFETYYTSVSAATPSNAYFSLQVKACWGLGTAATASATTTSYGAAPGHALAHQTIQRISADYDPTLKRRTFSKARTSAPPGVLPGTTESGNTAAVADAKREGSRKVGGGGRVPTPGVRAVLRRLGAEARAQGAAWGLAGLRRALHDADRWIGCAASLLGGVAGYTHTLFVLFVGFTLDRPKCRGSSYCFQCSPLAVYHTFGSRLGLPLRRLSGRVAYSRCRAVTYENGKYRQNWLSIEVPAANALMDGNKQRC